MFWNWIIYSVPWWVWTILGLIIVGAVQYFWGWQKALAALGVVAAVVLLGRSRQQGWEDKVKADLRAADKLIGRAVEARAKAEAEAAKHPENIRDDDGFRRD